MKKIKVGDKVEYIDRSKSGVVKAVSAHAIAIDFGGRRCVYVDPVECQDYLRIVKKTHLKWQFIIMPNELFITPTIQIWWKKETDITVVDFRIAWIVFDIGFTFWRL